MNNFADDTIAPVTGSSDRANTFVIAVQRYDYVRANYGNGDSTVRNAQLDVIRAFTEIRLKDGTWPSYPAPYDGETEYDTMPY